MCVYSWTNTRRSQSFVLPMRLAAGDDPVHKRLRELDVDQITPLQALTLLADLKREAQ